MTAPPISRDHSLEPNLAENASVKLIGLGGVGGIVARYGAMFLASLGRAVRLVLIDGDSFEPSNASRMFFGDCGNKAAVTRAELLPRFAESALALIAIEEFVTADNLPRLLHDGDIIILAVDNHATRKLVNDYCATSLRNVCLISAGNDGVGKDSAGTMRRGTYGNVQIFVRRDGRDLTPSLSRFHPEIAQPADHHPSEKGCADLIATVPQLLFTNLTVAACILNTLWLYLCSALHYGELAFDVAEARMQPVLPITTPAQVIVGDEVTSL